MVLESDIRREGPPLLVAKDYGLCPDNCSVSPYLEIPLLSLGQTMAVSPHLHNKDLTLIVVSRRVQWQWSASIQRVEPN